MNFLKEGVVVILIFTFVILSMVYDNLSDLLPKNILLFVAGILMVIAVFNLVLAFWEYTKQPDKSTVCSRIRLRIGMVYTLVAVFLVVMNYVMY